MATYVHILVDQETGVLYKQNFSNGEWEEWVIESGNPDDDMLKTTYDTNGNGIVDNAEKLENSTKTEIQNHIPQSHTHDDKYLDKENTTPFTPDADYEPSTKKYVDDSVSEAGGGDMLKAVYDTGDNGVVDNSEKLENSTKAQVQDHTPKAHTIASHSDTAATGAELEELTGGSETTLHSHAAGAGATVATGSYTGDGNSSQRQITTGFLPTLVFLRENGVNKSWFIEGRDTDSALYIKDPPQITPRVRMHATDGFTVANGTNEGNTDGVAYYWWAISG